MTGQQEPLLSSAGAASPLSHDEVTLSWEDIQFHVTGKTTKRILDKVSGSIKAGRLTAVMGPSGSGKSSLLNILAGRMRNGGKKSIDGRVAFKGREIDPASFRSKIAYVMQEDALFATQTAFEALEFSAAMRLPQTMTRPEREEKCERMLAVLGLSKQRDTFVGSKMVAGLSGGQKKRLACGVELITNPAIIFLDEPTSGLDSYAALQLCTILRRLAQGHQVGADVNLDDPEAAFGMAAAEAPQDPSSLTPHSVICTIHQPSSEVFQLFDDVILLGGGGVVYSGPRQGMSSCQGGDFFSSVGYPCPAEYNPADFVMFKLQQKGCRATPDAWAEYRERQEQEAAQLGGLGAKKKSSRLVAVGTAAAEITTAQAGLCRQFQYLAIREARNTKRDKKQLGARIGTSIFIMLLCGVVFKDIGNQWDTPDDVRDHFGALTQIAIAAMFGISQPVLLNFPLERPIFLREYASGTYGTFPYIVSKLLVDTPLSIAQAALMFLIAYWLLGLDGNFAYLTLSAALLGCSAAGLAIVMGSLASEPTVAVQLAPILFVPQFLFAGVFVATSQIPVWIRWAQYLCTLKYGVNLLAIAEFDGSHRTYQPVDPNGTAIGDPIPLIHGDGALFDNMDIHPDMKWAYFGIMMGFFVGFRLVAMVILAQRSKNPVS